MSLKINSKSLFLFLSIFTSLFLKYFSMWNYLFVGKFETPLILLALFCVVILFSLANFKILKRNFKKILFIIIMGIIIIIVNPKFDFLVSIILAIIFSAQDDGDKKFIKYYYINSLVFFVLTIVLYFIGVLPSNNSARVLENGILTRYSFGFAGINILFLCLLPLFTSFLIYKKKYVDKNKIKTILGIFIISFVFYKITLCRTGFIISLILIIIILLKDKLNKKVCDLFIKYSFIVLTVISIVFASKYNNFLKLNEILSNRLFFWNKYVDSYSLSLFGKDIMNKIPLDNVYITHLYIDGIIIFSFYVLINFVTSKKIKCNKMISIAFIIFALYGLFENNYSYQYNFILILQMIYFIDVDKSQKLLIE